ncbi:hypothetical protein [Phytobacter sp. V91]|uniref:hypothetical protein n=1 Tax=Phytobacter sp. V91 TaxID=3369425 RepID=UPI003F5F7A38
MRTEKFTNQYLWDLDCGGWHRRSPAAKSKGMPLSATRCFEWLLLLHINGGQRYQAKKNLHICAGWCNSSAQPSG